MLFKLIVSQMNFSCRYLINMDYSKDLPINTMGRRIRTRLYFTSESHLHTVLNTLRFPNPDHHRVGVGSASTDQSSSLLSEEGIRILNATPELCYLTQIVIRVFEDNRSEMADDPRRFRTEIWFSPGATATPMHLEEQCREQDVSRFDTAPLQRIGKEGLTCQEIEAFFEMAIAEGQMEEEDEETEFGGDGLDSSGR